MVIKQNVEMVELTKACSLGYTKPDRLPDNKKCLEILKKYFTSDSPNIHLVDIKGKSTWTPLMLCCYFEFLDGVNFLLENGASPNFVGTDGKSPLSILAIKNKTSLIHKLIKKGASVDYKDKQGKTALMEACEKGNFDNVKAFLENKANIKIKNIKNKTCLDIALEAGQYNIVKYTEHFYFDSTLTKKESPENKKTKI